MVSALFEASPGPTRRAARSWRLWQTTGLVTLQSGGPLTITEGADRSQTNLFDRAVYSGVAPYGPGPCVDYLNRPAFAQRL